MTQGDGHKSSEQLEEWAKSGKEGRPPVLAATVVLVRDGDDGAVETLMLKRNSKISFGGMWVFPGGKLDPEDWSGIAESDELGASRRAAVREAMEECGLSVEETSMVPFSHWTPPPITPKRFLTWFFVAKAEAGTVAIDDGEIKESQWMPVREALRRHGEAEIELVPPTYVTLTELSKPDSVDELLASAAGREPERYVTRIGMSDVGPVALWDGDAGYADGDPAKSGARHRLQMTKGGPWTYDRTA